MIKITWDKLSASGHSGFVSHGTCEEMDVTCYYDTDENKQTDEGELSLLLVTEGSRCLHSEVYRSLHLMDMMGQANEVVKMLRRSAF